MPRQTSATPLPKANPRRARGSLSRDEILDAAQDLVEAQGISELSMPSLARRVNSGVTSIYWYFASKDDLLVALTERVAHRMFHELPPIGNGPWKDEYFGYFVAFKRLIDETPVYREVFAGYPTVFMRTHARGNVLRRLEDGLTITARAGMEPEDALRTFRICSDYTRGFVLLSHGRDGQRPVEQDGFVLDPERYPNLCAAGGVGAATSLDDEDFSMGLRLLIDGLGRKFARRQRRSPGN